MSKVTFDYSKAMGFLSADEIAGMKCQAEAAKKVLVEKPDREMIIWDGLICR